MMKSGMFLAVVSIASLFLQASAAPVLKDGGVASPPPNLDSGTVQGLTRVAALMGREAMQAVNTMRSYLLTLYSDPDPLPPCFMKERSAEENSNPNTDYFGRLVEDYRSALAYSNYIQTVRQFFSESIEADPQCSYCVYLADVDRTTDRLTRSLANLVRYVNQTAVLSVTPPTQSSPLDSDKGGAGTDPAHCSDPCHEQQLRIYGRLLTFTSTYIPADVNGYQKLTSTGK